MLGAIAAIIAFAAASTEAGKIGNTTIRNRNDAIKSGSVYYIDGNGKWRATSTNEILYQQYSGGNKLVGVSTGKVYKDYDDERIDNFIREQNEKFEKAGVPIYYKKCTPYLYKDGKYKKYHLFEKKTDKPFKVLSKYKLVKKKNPCEPFSDEEFTIKYLDEFNGMKETGEYGFVPSKWYIYYKLGV